MNTTSGQFVAAPPRFPPCKWRQFLLGTVVYIPENHPLVNETNPLHSTTILDNHHFDNHSRQPSLSQPFSTTIIITTILDNYHYHNHSRQPSLSQPFSTTIIITTILDNHHYHNHSLQPSLSQPISPNPTHLYFIKPFPPKHILTLL